MYGVINKELQKNMLVHKQIQIKQIISLQVGMPISRRFSFLGYSGNREMGICHSSGILETKIYSPGSSENFGERVPRVRHGIPTHSIKGFKRCHVLDLIFG